MFLELIPSKTYNPKRLFSYTPVHLTNLDVAEKTIHSELIKYVERILPTEFYQLSEKIKLIEKKLRCKKGKIRLIGPNFSLDSLIVNALASESGEIIILAQHGYIANQKDLPAFFMLEFLFNGYVSWGIEKYGKYNIENIKSLPGGYMHKFANKHKEEAERIVFVSTAQYTDQVCMLDNTIGKVNYARRSRLMKMDFLSRLKSELIGRVYYRYYSAKRAQFLDKSYVKMRFDDLKLIGEKELNCDFHEFMFCSRLVVLDHPGTTLSVILASNTPFVLFFDENMWPMLEDTYDDFKALKNVGIFFNSPAEAAMQVNKIFETVKEWWNEPERKKVVEKFRYNFARTSKYWYCDWMKWLIGSYR